MCHVLCIAFQSWWCMCRAVYSPWLNALTLQSKFQSVQKKSETINLNDFNKMANKKCWKKLFFFFIIQIELVKITPMNIDPPRPIQILIPENHSFRLNSKELQPIFENENIKNRQLFIVSIAGPHRQGKSFLMSFFIRFLNAQVNWKKKKKMQFYKWTAKKKLPKPKPNGEFCRFFFSNVPIFSPPFLV